MKILARRQRWEFRHQDVVQNFRAVLTSRLRLLRSLSGWMRGQAAHGSPALLAVQDAPRLNVGFQWVRIGHVLAEGSHSADKIMICQSEAAAQIDAALYALNRLKAEVDANRMTALGTPTAQSEISTIAASVAFRRQDIRPQPENANQVAAA